VVTWLDQLLKYRAKGVTDMNLDDDLVGLRVVIHKASNPEGIAVLVPGFFDSKDYASSVELARKLPSIGITAVRFDPRGTWESGNCPAKCTTTQQVHDLTDMLNLLPCRNVDRQILIGFCYGAYVAALSAAINEQITEVVAIMPTHTFIWSEGYDESKDTWRTDGERFYLRDVLGSTTTALLRVPYSVAEDARAYSAISPWESIRQSIFFVAAEQDDVITPTSVRQLYEKCPSRHKSLAILSGMRHDYRYDETQIKRVNHAILEWLCRGDN
jgi:pimeloyl-ACP methyl ester carboxylesterase